MHGIRSMDQKKKSNRNQTGSLQTTANHSDLLSMLRNKMNKSTENQIESIKYFSTTNFDQNEKVQDRQEVRKFEHHIAGVFVLYRDMTNTVFEIQHQSIACNGANHCTCGVAIRSGTDVFKIDYCSGKRLIEYVTCHEQILEVKRLSDTSYLATLPTGTSIQINIENIYNTKYLAAFINPSIYDYHNTRGLCGNISTSCKDDFVDPYGKPTGDVGSNYVCGASRFTPTAFINAWKVADSDNLFKLTIDSPMAPSLTTSAYCKCPSEGDTSTEAADFACSASSTFDCEIKQESESVGAHICTDSIYGRKKRSLEYPFRTAENKRRRRRSIEENQQKEVNMSPEDANKFCLSFMEESPVFNACKDIPEVKADEYLEICALDIALTRSLSWANQTLEAFKTSCMKEIRMNNTLKEAGPNGQPSIASTIKDKICPGNPMCSSNGDCFQGKCRCFEGFLSPDCSVDLGMAPELIGVRGDGLCDKNEITCNESYVVAEEIYSTSNLTCTIQMFQINSNGSYTLAEEHSVKAKYETLVEVLCPLLPKRVKRSTTYVSDEDNFASAFKISVSYDGIMFSDNVEMVVYDSRCQEVVNTTDRIYFNLMDGFCKLDDRCIPEGNYSSDNRCLICDTAISKYSWTRISDTNECVQIENVSNNAYEIQTTILATCIPIAIILILAIVVGLVKYNKLKTRRKITASQEFGTICKSENMPST